MTRFLFPYCIARHGHLDRPNTQPFRFNLKLRKNLHYRRKTPFVNVVLIW